MDRAHTELTQRIEVNPGWIPLVTGQTVARITRIQGQFLAQTYNAERLVPWFEGRSGASVDRATPE